jgi:hypothetical protein
MTVQPYRPLELMRNTAFTKHSFDDFIGVWNNFVPASFCDELVQYFEDTYNANSSVIQPEGEYSYESFVRGEDAYQGSLNRKDISMLLNYHQQDLSYKVHQFLTSCVLHYIVEYDQLKKVAMISSDLKMQKTSPGGGYHLWHYENSAHSHAQRELTWMIYLNDIPDGEGETEFLYQRRRIKPTKGTVVIWPAGMTHVHKGNTVLTTDKYILTGWYIKTGK